MKAPKVCGQLPAPHLTLLLGVQGVGQVHHGVDREDHQREEASEAEAASHCESEVEDLQADPIMTVKLTETRENAEDLLHIGPHVHGQGYNKVKICNIAS